MTFFLMAFPALFFLLIFNYLPMVGLVIAFQRFRFQEGIFGSEWVGFQNFEFLFSPTSGVRITVNTLGLNALFIFTTLVASLFVAIMLNEVRESLVQRFYQLSLFFPYFISWIIAGYFVFALLNTNDGLVNQMLVSLGYEPIRWYSSPEYWPAILTLTNLWKQIGFWSIVYLAGILGINPELYEVSQIDGANKLQQVFRITIPMLSSLIIINVLLSVGRIFYADFGLFFHVPRDSGLLYPTTDVIDTFVYRALRQTGDIGMAAAAGFYQAIVGFVLVLISNWIVRQVDPEQALF
ncbi:MAG: sugar ABC transporter permease [Chloroflexi bacterium]|nr:sugar ABC transporter permease [Chloroflexota bacterium]